MKKRLLLIAGLTLATSVFALNPTPEPPHCKGVFGRSLQQCVITNATLPRPERRVANQACTVKARAAKTACESGVPQCQANCQATYDSAVIVCDSSYDTGQCAGAPVCEQILGEQNAECRANAVNALNTCKNSCQ